MAHALTYRNDFLREHANVLTVSVGLHLLLLVLLILNINLMPRREPQPTRLAIEAVVVDSKAQRRRAADEAAQRQLALEAERRRQEQELAENRRVEEQRRAEAEQADARRREAEQQRVAETRRAEEKKREADEARVREAKAAEQRKATEAKAAAAKVAEQRKAEEAQKLAAAETARKAEADRRAAQAKADLARQMAEEEEFAAAADSGLLDQYAEVIRQKVERNWSRPASAREGINCVVMVKQIPGGEVVEVRVTDCNGDAAVVQSIERAVLRASPLPPPPDPSLFDRSLRFDFRPRD